MSNGLFITFEGGEGSGKTTQINRLSSLISEAGRKVITTREPGGTPEAEKIRELVVQREGGKWTPEAELLLFFAARHMHVSKVIQPALDEGKIIISDRFTDSTRAYQGYGHELGLDLLENINSLILKNFKPSITFILDIDPEVGLKRSDRRLAAEQFVLSQREDRYENLDIEFHKRLRQGFLEIAKKEPNRCHVIDASQDIDEVTKQIQQITQRAIEEGA